LPPPDTSPIQSPWQGAARIACAICTVLGPGAIAVACASYPTIAHLFANGGYAGEKLENALHKIEGPAIEIVRRPDGATGFIIVARRWVVERTLAWLNRCRRLAKDWEASVASAEAWLLVASTRLLARRIARMANVKS
jgi:transposase